MTRRLILLAIGALLAASVHTATAQAGTYHMDVCGLSGSPSPFGPASGAGVTASSACGNGGNGYQLNAGTSVGYNQGASWSTTAPAGIAITHVYTQYDRSNGVGDGKGYYGAFNWDGGVSNQITDTFSTYGCCQFNFYSAHLSWAITCRWSSGCTFPAYMYVGQIDVTLDEPGGPSVGGGGALWSSSGWVRGTWPVGFSASDPSGVCGSAIGLTGQTIPGPGAAPNHGGYTQCPNWNWSTNIDTAASSGSSGAGAGGMTLGISATNAAGVSSYISRAVYADNVTPNVSLSGPSYALDNAGEQYVTARAAAGPSGVSGINCSVDGGAYQYYPGAAATVGLLGAGIHHTTCVSYNNARDVNGNVAASAPRTLTTVIAVPTLSSIWFSKLHNPLRCRLVRKRQRVAAHYRYVRRHGHRVRVRVPAHYRTVKVKQCHARVVRRRVAYWTTAVRHHRRVRVKHYRWVRSVVFPSTSHATIKHVGYGGRATVQGWLGSSWLAPVPGQVVIVYTAPDNGQGVFSPAAFAVTDANGLWSATLPPGPSRIVDVGYGGALGGAVTASASPQIMLDVPAHMHLRRTPRAHVPWGSRVRFTGYLAGGYVPPRGELIRVRLGLGSAHTTVATVQTKPDGTFAFSYTFGAGSPSDVRPYWFQFITLPETAYPFTQGASRKVHVTVGG